MKIWRMPISYWITKATDTHTHYVIRIAFPLQQWLHEHATLLRHTILTVFLCLECTRVMNYDLYTVLKI
jgi:hypothetical protein